MQKHIEYFDRISEIIDKVRKEEMGNIEKAIDIISQSLKNGGMLYTFGTGHSQLLCCEPFFRAGGISACYPIVDMRFFPLGENRTQRERVIEREEGIVDNVRTDYPLKKGDVMIIYNYGGRNSTSVDVALICKEIGVTTIDITSMYQSTRVTPLHSSGKMVQDVCDLIIDNHGPMGDACVDFDGYTVGPCSTVIGSVITQSIICGVVEKLTAEGVDPGVFKSSNIPGGDEHNKEYVEKYSKIIKCM